MYRVATILGAAAAVVSACASDTAQPQLEAYEPAPVIPPAYKPDTPVVDISELGLRRIDEFVGYPMENAAGGGSTQPRAVLADPAAPPELLGPPRTVEVVLVDTPEVVQLAGAVSVIEEPDEPEAIEAPKPADDDAHTIERAPLPSLADLLDWAPALPQVGRTAVLIPSQRD